MHATIYGRGQMVIPAQARKAARIDRGDVVSVEPDGDGRILLVRLEKPRRRARSKVRIVHREGTHAVGSAGRTLTSELVRSLLAEFP
jgi:AbrB family looped-hinge helix DNA binding protein